MATNYLNNPNLKASNVNLDYTKEQLKEYLKCKEDPIYFIEKYIKVVHADYGLINVKLYPKQKETIEALFKNRKIILKSGRQFGKTMVMGCFFIHYTIFNNNKTVVVLANKNDTAQEILDKAKIAYENLPHWIQQGVGAWNKRSVEFENGSRIICRPTSSSGIRGFMANFIFLDEFAHVPQNIAEEFFASVYPTISSGLTTKIAIASTPLGLNHFYKFWKGALDNINGFVPININWRDVPWYNEVRAEEEKRTLGDVRFAQEIEADFCGSSNTLIESAKLSNCYIAEPIRNANYSTVYEENSKDKSYVIAVDTSHGKGMDYSTFVVIDVTEIPYRVVAKYRNNTIIPILYPEIIYNAAVRYNNAMVLIETNDIGQQVADIMTNDYEYENIVWSSSNITFSTFNGDRPGIRMTKKIKMVGCSTLKELVETDKLILNDIDIIHELSNFVQKANTYKAAEGYNDDLAMNLVLFSYYTTTEHFKDYINLDIREKLLKYREEQIENEIAPFGFILDGRDETIIDDDALWEIMYR